MRYLSFVLPFAVWILSGFDGAGRVRTLIGVVRPDKQSATQWMEDPIRSPAPDRPGTPVVSCVMNRAPVRSSVAVPA